MAKTLKDLRPGDHIGFCDPGLTGAIINLGTFAFPGHGLTHVGIVAHLRGQRKVIFESTSLMSKVKGNECIVQEDFVSGVQCHPIEHILGRGQKVWVYRRRRPLKPVESACLTKFLLGQIGKPYDMAGCLESGGGKIKNWISQFFFKNDTVTVFCSELTAMCENLLVKGTFENPGRWNPNATTRYLVSDGELFSAERLV